MNESKTVVSDQLVELQNTHKLAELLLKTPHYLKIGAEGIFAIIEAARSLGIDTMQALNGGLYYTKGKVEMKSIMMNALIRSRGHSITRDKNSNNEICILHGKRCDNGDHWTESFSWDEANAAGLTKNDVWKNYTRDMLFARALSRLARQLFPDIIGNCYVEGEISLDDNIKDKDTKKDEPTINTNKLKTAQINLLKADMQPYEEDITNKMLKYYQIEKLDDMTQDKFLDARSRIQVEKQKKDAESHNENS